MNAIARKIQTVLENSPSCRGETASLLHLLSDAQDEINRLESLVPKKIPRLYRVVAHPDIIVLRRNEETLAIVWTKDSLEHADPYPTCVPSNIFRIEELGETEGRSILELRKDRGFVNICG